MLVGQVIPYIVPAVIQGTGGVTTSQTIQKEEVGIKLNVIPKVNADGYITTIVTPELSSVLRFTGPDNTLPIVSRRIANTTVRLRDRCQNRCLARLDRASKPESDFPATTLQI